MSDHAPNPSPPNDDDMSRLRDEANREEFAIRRLLRDMTADEHRLEREMQTFEEDEQAAEKTIENDWRAVHWGKAPERPSAWRPAPRDTPRRDAGH
jgi:uncharacterized protein involved in exopolysaccharide biosynthesis